MDGKGKGGGERGEFLFNPAPTPLLPLDRLSPLLIQISFSSQPSASVKFKNGRYYFHQENSEPSLATITPALQATMLSNTMFKAIVSVFQLVSCDQNQSNNDRQTEKKWTIMRHR